jgi:hypothetical protein
MNEIPGLCRAAQAKAPPGMTKKLKFVIHNSGYFKGINEEVSGLKRQKAPRQHSLGAGIYLKGFAINAG